ncbi:PrgH/EprH family type III secretion apparatus protein [Pantoea agglomerans]|uniref:PrgH/EprH family type III secretion apparatus protein n=1 Tax=Enterobacter agglomerans TaxID=549 RepID=UPI0013B6309B|nr:PrgH/EprH family type III secretion apparatus protein [Pantoea agglomerans]NEG59863.1 PrgH/EprH family type III secretion apparatus protein [Pantoea agglomerans]NEG98832.1 PrgH/EprH family type III secretion apparatus protein [Pantoea agglomerans]NEH05184.1 PrgH/EprH family type III secretion apparatus protein [Pantoea agglomerans]NEH16173.1 PrgH/EprH family type III secretion apparatus protein [Pantoea agglomerans]
MSHHSQNKDYTLKVLFGPLYGCELTLPPASYFFIVNSEGSGSAQPTVTEQLSAEQQHCAQYAANTLYIPGNQPAPNFTLHLAKTAEDDAEQGFLVEILDADDSASVRIKENEIFTHGSICFALKQSDAQWSEEVINFQRRLDTDNHADTVITVHKKNFNKYVLGIIAILLLATICWYVEVNRAPPVVSLNKVFENAPTHVELIASRDGKAVYALANEHQTVEWVQAVIHKRDSGSKLILFDVASESESLIARFSRAGYPVLQIDFSSPAQPVIALYREMKASERKAFKQFVLQKIPFASDFGTRVRTKEQLRQDASTILDRLNIYYRVIKTPDGYAFIVQDALSDTALAGLQRFIHNFNRQWGDSIISFSFNMNEDWLRDKSYLDSSSGYIFLNPKHWYFINNKELQ